MYQPILVATSLLAFGAAFNKQHIESESHHQYTVDLSSDVWPWRSFKTSPHTPPELNVSHYGGKKLADGYMFVSPTDSKNNDGLYELSGTGFVFDMRGDLVYAAEETGTARRVVAQLLCSHADLLDAACRNGLLQCLDWR